MDESGIDQSEQPLSKGERPDVGPFDNRPPEGEEPVPTTTLPSTSDDAAVPPPPLPPAPAGVEGETEPGAVPGAPGKRKRTVLWVSVGAVALLIVIGIVVAVSLSGGASITMPAAIAGESKLESSSAQVLATGMSETIKKQTGADALAGIYGTEAEPKFLVLAINATPESGDPLEEIGPGIKQSVGASYSLDTSNITRRTVGSTSYECAPASVSSSNGTITKLSMCTWEDGDTVGVVVGLDPSVDGMDVVAKAHDAVVS